MPICSRCHRRVWFWYASLLGGPCSHCRREQCAAREALAAARAATRRATFENSSPLQRAWWSAKRGAMIGAGGLIAIGVSLFVLISGDHSTYPFQSLSLNWFLLSLFSVAIAGVVGWWLSSWLIGVGLLIGIGLIGGGILGAYQGWRGRWVLFG